MDQRYYGQQQEGYGYPGGMNLDSSVRENRGQLTPRNSDYVVRPDGPVAALPKDPVVSPLKSRRLSVAAARGKPRRSTPYPKAVEEYDPSLYQQQGSAQGEHARIRRQYARDVAAPIDSRTSISGSQASSSRASNIVEKKKKIVERKQTPRVPRSVAAPVDSRSSLSSASASESAEISSRRAKKILKKYLRDTRDESQNSSRKQKKAAKKGKKDHKGSKKNKKNRSKRSAKKSVRFAQKNPASPYGPDKSIELAHRHAAIIARENAIGAKQGPFNGYINENFNGGYFDLTSSQDEPGFLIKVPVNVMLRALEIADSQSLRAAQEAQHFGRVDLNAFRPKQRQQFEVYQDREEDQACLNSRRAQDYRRQAPPAEGHRYVPSIQRYQEEEEYGYRRPSLSSQRRG